MAQIMEEHKYLEFLRKHWSKLLLGFLAVASIAAWSERFFSANHIQSQQDFLIGNQIFERFQKGEPLAVESIETTEKILARHPELHPKYDPMLAMTYFAQRNPSKGLPYAKSTLEHVTKELPSHYKSFANTSLLIAEKKYPEAYEAAQSLHAQLKSNEANSTLYVMNLLRLVSLEMEMGKQQSEAWNELHSHPAFASLSPIFQEGALSLEDWHSLRLNN